MSVATRWLNLAATPAPWAPTVTANLTRSLLLDVASLLERPPARLIASGVVESEADEVVAAFEACGMVERERRIEGEWAAVVLEGPDRGVGA